MLPRLIPLLALAAMAGGGVTLGWYSGLSKEDKDRANKLTGDTARELFGKSVDALSRGEAQQVHALIQGRFSN